MIPYDPALITRLLRSMADARLAVAEPGKFQAWPAQAITPGATIRELIKNEQARRRRKA